MSGGNPLCFILTTQIRLCCGLNVYSYMWFCPVPHRSSEGLTRICVLAFRSWSCWHSWAFGLKSQLCLSSVLSLSPSAVKLQVRRLVRVLHNVCPAVLSLRSSYLKADSLAVAYPSPSLLTSLSGSIFLSADGVGETVTQKGLWWSNVFARARLVPGITAALRYCQYVYTFCQSKEVKENSNLY